MYWSVRASVYGLAWTGSAHVSCTWHMTRYWAALISISPSLYEEGWEHSSALIARLQHILKMQQLCWRTPLGERRTQKPSSSKTLKISTTIYWKLTLFEHTWKNDLHCWLDGKRCTGLLQAERPFSKGAWQKYAGLYGTIPELRIPAQPTAIYKMNGGLWAGPVTLPQFNVTDMPKQIVPTYPHVNPDCGLLPFLIIRRRDADFRMDERCKTCYCGSVGGFDSMHEAAKVNFKVAEFPEDVMTGLSDERRWKTNENACIITLSLGHPDCYGCLHNCKAGRVLSLGHRF